MQPHSLLPRTPCLFTEMHFCTVYILLFTILQNGYYSLTSLVLPQMDTFPVIKLSSQLELVYIFYVDENILFVNILWHCYLEYDT